MFTIDTLVGHERMSTQDLLLAIGQAVAQGETEFEIHASGQHDIGGPLWHPEGKKLFFHVTNAGQRVGCMCLDNTEIVVLQVMLIGDNKAIVEYVNKNDFEKESE